MMPPSTSVKAAEERSTLKEQTLLSPLKFPPDQSKPQEAIAATLESYHDKAEHQKIIWARVKGFPAWPVSPFPRSIQ